MDFSSESPQVQALAGALGLTQAHAPINFDTSMVSRQSPTQPQPGFFSKLAGEVGNAASWAGGHVWSALSTAVSAFPRDIAMNLNRRAALNPLFEQMNVLDQQEKQLYAQAKSMPKAQYGAALRALTTKQLQLSANIKGANEKYQYAGTGQVARDYAGLAGAALTVAAPFTAPLEAGGTVLGAELGATGTKVAQGVEKVVAGVVGKPGASLGRNATAQGPVTAMQVAEGVAGKAVRNAAFTQPMVNLVPQMVNDVQEKNYSSLVANIGLMVTVPALIHFAAPVIAEGMQRLGLKLFGNPSFLGRFQFANGQTFQSFFQDLSQKAATGDPQAQLALMRYTNIAKQFVDHNAQEGNSAADIISSEAKNLRPVGEQTPQQFLDYHGSFIADTQKVQDVVAANPEKYGIPPGVPEEQLGAGNFGIAEKNALINELLRAPDQAAREGILIRDSAQNKDYTRNKGVFDQIWAAVKGGKPNAVDQIRDITASRVIKGADDLKLSNGRIPIVKPRGAAGFTDPAELPEPTFGQPAGPVAGRFGNLIQKLGLSPQAVQQGATRAAVRENFDRELQGTQFEGQGTGLLRALDEARNTAGVADLRELKVQDIQLAMERGATRADAQVVRAAIHRAYARVPASVVGAGPKAVNIAVARVPFMDQYLRVQQKYKFDSNPFFKAKRATKNYLAAVAKGGQVLPHPSQETLQALREDGLFNRFLTDAGVGDFLGVTTEELTGKAAVEGGEKVAALGAKGRQLGALDQRVIGGLAEEIAGRFGMSVPEAFTSEDQTVADVIRANAQLTVGYGKGGYLNSPLAKTLNILVFPSRFDTKIGMIAYHALASQPPIVQAMITRGVVNMANFLQSPQGQLWQQQNAELLGIVKYFTPLGTVEGVMNFLTRGYHIGDLGEIGGLPFGVITTFLNETFPYGPLGQSQYYDPATGSPVPVEVPNTSKAGLQVLIQTLIESTFTWPGKQAGLPVSKTQIVQAIPGLKPAKGETTPTFAPGVNPQGNNQATAAAVAEQNTVQPIVNPQALATPSSGRLPTFPTPSSTRAPKRARVKTVPANLQIQR